jgi:hypothetical protein
MSEHEWTLVLVGYIAGCTLANVLIAFKPFIADWLFDVRFWWKWRKQRGG